MGENMKNVIDIKISKYRASGAKIFTGRDNGMKARKELDLNRMDNEQDNIRILVPTDTWGINPSFFGGMFEGSIKKYGDNFLNKYTFCYTNGDKISESLNKDIMDDFNFIIRNVSVDK